MTDSLKDQLAEIDALTARYGEYDEAAFEKAMQRRAATVRRLAAEEEAASIRKASATRVAEIEPDTHRSHAQARAPEAPGTDFARIIKAMIKGRGDPRVAAQIAEASDMPGKYRIAKALGASDAVGGGFL